MARTKGHELTPDERKREILAEYLEGRTLREIGDSRSISPQRISALLQKTPGYEGAKDIRFWRPRYFKALKNLTFELWRVCEVDGCEISLAFESRGRRFCSECQRRRRYDVVRKLYSRRTALGLCKCGADRAEGRLACDDCLKFHRRATRRHYKKKKEERDELNRRGAA